MTHYEHNLVKLRRAIMWRVWYSYLVSLVASPIAAQGLVLGASAVALWQLTSLTSIARNFLQVPVGGVPKYVQNTVLNALESGEFLTLLAAGLFLGVSVSLALRLRPFVFTPLVRM